MNKWDIRSSDFIEKSEILSYEIPRFSLQNNGNFEIVGGIIRDTCHIIPQYLDVIVDIEIDFTIEERKWG
jgi:hypothetical protein